MHVQDGAEVMCKPTRADTDSDSKCQIYSEPQTAVTSYQTHGLYLPGVGW